MGLGRLAQAISVSGHPQPRPQGPRTAAHILLAKLYESTASAFLELEDAVDRTRFAARTGG
jgi:hypothetical protein